MNQEKENINSGGDELSKERMDEIDDLVDQNRQSEISPDELKRWSEQTDRIAESIKQDLARKGFKIGKEKKEI